MTVEYAVPIIKTLRVLVTKHYGGDMDEDEYHSAHVIEDGILLYATEQCTHDDAKDTALCWIHDQYPIPKAMETNNHAYLPS